MADLKNYRPMYILDPYKGTDFRGEWPTIPEMFKISVKRCPDRPCFIDFAEDGSKRSFSYTDVQKHVLKLAGFLIENGLAKGDKVAVTGRNSPEWGTVFLATLFAGGIICPIDWALSTDLQENLLAAAQPKFLFVDEDKYEHYESSQIPYELYSLSPKHSGRYVYKLEPKVDHPLPSADLEDTAAILFTSGTTSKPKGVMLSHKNLVSDCYSAQDNMKLYQTDVFYNLLPIHHAYTMQAAFIEPLSVGAAIVFGKSLSVSKIMADLKNGEVTMLLGVPMLFNKFAAGIQKGIKNKGPAAYGLIRLLMGISYTIKKLTGSNPGKKMFASVLKQANLSTVRIAISGGGPLDKNVFKFFNEMGIDFVQGYGLTETSPIVALNPVEHFKIESVGSYFAKHMEMKIDKPGADGVGEICVRGPMVMQGYYRMSDETAKVIDGEGWFHTGDLGWLDSEGYLMLSGRAKNMIVTSGGKNVYPEEIEDQFQMESAIQQITVQGYTSSESGDIGEGVAEEIEALVYPSDTLYESLSLERKDGEQPDAVQKAVNESISKVNRRLQPYQRITKVTLLDKPLEMTTTLKVKRNYNKN
ncbi:MAG: AMP-binding protein [Treponema sp.]|nr:AMP-binding protein [Treponema sp.]